MLSTHYRRKHPWILPALRRVLRSLASVGLFRTDAQGRFSLTPLGAAWSEVLHSVGWRVLKAAGLADRCEFVEGDFLQAVTEGGDAYIVSHCIHNWDEGDCVRTWSTADERCRRAHAC